MVTRREFQRAIEIFVSDTFIIEIDIWSTIEFEIELEFASRQFDSIEQRLGKMQQIQN